MCNVELGEGGRRRQRERAVDRAEKIAAARALHAQPRRHAATVDVHGARAGGAVGAPRSRRSPCAADAACSAEPQLPVRPRRASVRVSAAEHCDSPTAAAAARRTGVSAAAAGAARRQNGPGGIPQRPSLNKHGSARPAAAAFEAKVVTRPPTLAAYVDRAIDNH